MGNHEYLYHSTSKVFSKKLKNPHCNLGRRKNTAGAGSPKINHDISDTNKDQKYYLQSDFIIQGKFYWGTNILIDLRFTELRYNSKVRTNPSNVLGVHERENNKRYLDLCI